MYLSNINIRHQLFIHGGRSFRKPSLRWILHIMDQWLYSISDHCFDDHTNYRQNCYSSIVDGIVFASDVKWAGSTSDCFKVGMGDRQGGTLSTDLYKLYICMLLRQVEQHSWGTILS
jgi:hypothetical protein